MPEVFARGQVPEVTQTSQVFQRPSTCARGEQTGLERLTRSFVKTCEVCFATSRRPIMGHRDLFEQYVSNTDIGRRQ